MVGLIQPVDTRAARIMTWTAMSLVLATDAAYVLLIRAQRAQEPPGGGAFDVFTVPFVAAYLLVMAVLLMISLLRFPAPALRMPLRAASAGGLLVLGLLAIFSVGLPLVIAGALATGATVSTLRGPLLTPSALWGAAAAVIAVAVLIVGFEVAGRIIVCPATGVESGGNSGFVTGGYHWECVNGTLTMHSGQCNSSSGGVDANGNATATSGC